MADMTLEEALAVAAVDEELVTPVNEVLLINPETRTINVPDSEKLFGARQDMDVERKYFKCPRIVGDNIDLFEHEIFVNYVPSKQDGSYDAKEEVQCYWCRDLAVEGDFVTFSWKLSENVTRSAGYIAFAVYAKTIDEYGNLQTKWHTTIAIGNVLDTLPDGEELATVYPDIVMQLLERMDELENGETLHNVLYSEQVLTEEQKMQARKNIGAANSEEVSKLSKEIDNLKENGTGSSTSGTTENILEGKTILAIGDSFVAGHTLGESHSWVTKIAERNDMTAHIYATNGISLTGSNSTTLAKQIDTITAQVSSTDFVVLLAGHNDSNASLNGGSAVPIGTNSDTTYDTFKGGLNYVIKKLLAKYPTAQFLFLTPFNRRGTEEAYAEAMKEICGIWCVPCFDNYHNGNMCFQSEGQSSIYELDDSLHFNDLGLERLSWLYENKIRYNLSLEYSLNLCSSVKVNGGDFATIKIAACDSTDEDKALADIVCDGINDEVELNQAMEMFAEKSGTIVLATGNYYIGSLLTRTYNGITVKYGILMDHPLSHRQITLKANNYTTRSSQNNNDYSISDNMTAVIHLTDDCYNSIGANDVVNVIGGYPQMVFPNMCLEVNNIAIKLQGNNKKIIGIDGKYLSILKSEGVVMSCEQSQTVNPRCIGIRSSQGWCEGIQNEIKHSKINGFGCGFLLAGEHLVATEIMPHRCYYGIVIGNYTEVGTFDRTGMHNITLLNCSIEKCNRGLTFGSATGNPNVITIIDLNNETFDDCDWVAKETVKGAYYGSISYYNISATSWKPSTLPFWQDSSMGRTFRCINQVSKFNGTSDEKPSNPDFLFQFYDTDEKVMYFWNGVEWLPFGGGVTKIQYSVLNNLTNVINLNISTSAEEGSSYVANISANEGYILSSLTVSMNNVDITSSVYSNGVISIPEVTGNIIITAVAIEDSGVTTYKITKTLTNVVSSDSSINVEENSSYSTNLTAVSGYKLDSVTVMMGGNDITSSVYSNGQINIASVTGNIVIIAVASELPRLSTPLNLIITNDILSWDPVENAVSYNLYDGNKLLVNTNETLYNLSNLEEAQHLIYVMAIGDNINFKDSVKAMIEYNNSSNIIVKWRKNDSNSIWTNVELTGIRNPNNLDYVAGYGIVGTKQGDTMYGGCPKTATGRAMSLTQVLYGNFDGYEIGLSNYQLSNGTKLEWVAYYSYLDDDNYFGSTQLVGEYNADFSGIAWSNANKLVPTDENNPNTRILFVSFKKGDGTTDFTVNELEELKELFVLTSDTDIVEEYKTIQGFPQNNNNPTKFMSSTNGATFIYMKVNSGSTYRVSRDELDTTRFRIMFMQTPPENETALYNQVIYDNELYGEETCPNDCEYIGVYVGGTAYPTIPKGFSIEKITE